MSSYPAAASPPPPLLPPPPVCGLCLEAYGDVGERLPKVLACGHTYCAHCLHAFFTRSKKGIRRFALLKCPLCRCPVLSKQLVTNVGLLNMMQDVADHMGPALRACSQHGPEKIYAVCVSCGDEGLCRLCMLDAVTTPRHHGHHVVTIDTTAGGSGGAKKEGAVRRLLFKKKKLDGSPCRGSDSDHSSDSCVGMEQTPTPPPSRALSPVAPPSPAEQPLPARDRLSLVALEPLGALTLPKPCVAAVSRNDDVFLVDKDRQLLCRYVFQHGRFELRRKASNSKINLHDVRSMLATPRGDHVVIQHSQVTSVLDGDLYATSHAPDTRGLLDAIDEKTGRYVYRWQASPHEYELTSWPAPSPRHARGTTPSQPPAAERGRRVHGNVGHMEYSAVATAGDITAVVDRNNCHVTVYTQGRCYVRKCRQLTPSGEWKDEPPHGVCVTPHGLIWLSFSSGLALYDAIREVKRFSNSSLGIQGIITQIWYSNNGLLHVKDSDEMSGCNYIRTFKIMQ